MVGTLHRKPSNVSTTAENGGSAFTRRRQNDPPRQVYRARRCFDTARGTCGEERGSHVAALDKPDARWCVAAIFLAIVAAVALAVAAGNGAGTRPKQLCLETRTAGRRCDYVATPLTSPPKLVTAAPTTPTAKRCDSSALDGPSAPPTGAMVVSTAQNLADAVAAHPDHTTCWMPTGTHRLGIRGI